MNQALAGPSRDAVPSIRSYFSCQAVLPRNMSLEDVTATEFQLKMSWLNADAFKNMYCMSVTVSVFQFPMS
jgi:hypothetical protein